MINKSLESRAMRYPEFLRLERRANSFAATCATGILLCLTLWFAPGRAVANMPAVDLTSQVCVLEGFLIRAPTVFTRLKYVDQIDWSKFEGRTVRFKWRFGRGMDLLLTPPEIVGPCDPALISAALPRALAQRAENEFVFQKEHDRGLDEIRRAIALAPENCEFIASYVFMLETLGRYHEAIAQSASVKKLKSCSQVLYQQNLRLLRQGLVLVLP